MKKINRIVLKWMFVFLVILILCLVYKVFTEKKFGGEFISVEMENNRYYVTTATMENIEISKITRYVQYVIAYVAGFSFLFLMLGIAYFWTRYLVLPSTKNILFKFKIEKSVSTKIDK